MRKLNSHRHIVLAAAPGWGIHEYVDELKFQLAEKNPDLHTCFIDLRPAHSITTFMELFASALSISFPTETLNIEKECSCGDILTLPEIIARRLKIRIAIFFTNAHLLYRFKNHVQFLRMLKLKLKNQKNCIICFSGNRSPNFSALFNHPSPLSNLGQFFELSHNQQKHRSASIRKLFHDSKKHIGLTTSFQMSSAVDNNPFYLKLLAWHALIMTQKICTSGIVEESLNTLILHFDHQFYHIADNLTLKQLNFLRALVDGSQKLYSLLTREEYQMGSTSNVARIKSCLERKGIIHTGREETIFADPIFREWLRNKYFT